MTTNTTGPAYLREVAMGLRRMGFPISAPSLEQLAAAWDADIARAEHAEAALARAREEIEGAHARLDECGVRRTSDEAAGITHSLQYRIFEMHKAIERAQTIIALYEGRHPAGLGPDGKEIAPHHRYNGDGICIRCGADAETDTGCVEELRAALGNLQGAVEKVRNVYPHDPNCSGYAGVGACDCWQAMLEEAMK